MHKCVVVPESELDVVKRSLSTLTSFHIFSVQKAKLKVGAFFPHMIPMDSVIHRSLVIYKSSRLILYRILFYSAAFCA